MTVPERARFPVVIADDYGGMVEIDTGPPGDVSIFTSPQEAFLNAAQREEFAQAWIAACHEADRQEAHDG